MDTVEALESASKMQTVLLKDAAAKGMSTSPFNKLSAEIRNQIWAYTVIQEDAFKVGFFLEDGVEKFSLARSDKLATSLLLTCKQIRHECGSMFYRGNTFDIAIHCVHDPFGATYRPGRKPISAALGHFLNARMATQIAHVSMNTTKPFSGIVSLPQNIKNFAGEVSLLQEILPPQMESLSISHGICVGGKWFKITASAKNFSAIGAIEYVERAGWITINDALSDLGQVGIMVEEA